MKRTRTLTMITILNFIILFTLIFIQKGISIYSVTTGVSLAIFIIVLISISPWKQQAIIEKDRYYFRSRNDAVMFEDIERLSLSFGFEKGEGSKRRQTIYNISLDVEIKGKRMGYTLPENPHYPSFWPLIEACREYNTSGGDIDVSSLIPETESELEEIRRGWERQIYDVVEKVKRDSLKEYSELTGMSEEDLTRMMILGRRLLVAIAIAISLYQFLSAFF